MIVLTPSPMQQRRFRVLTDRLWTSVRNRVTSCESAAYPRERIRPNLLDTAGTLEQLRRIIALTDEADGARAREWRAALVTLAAMSAKDRSV